MTASPWRSELDGIVELVFVCVTAYCFGLLRPHAFSYEFKVMTGWAVIVCVLPYLNKLRRFTPADWRSYTKPTYSPRYLHLFGLALMLIVGCATTITLNLPAAPAAPAQPVQHQLDLYENELIAHRLMLMHALKSVTFDSTAEEFEWFDVLMTRVQHLDLTDADATLLFDCSQDDQPLSPCATLSHSFILIKVMARMLHQARQGQDVRQHHHVEEILQALLGAESQRLLSK